MGETLARWWHEIWIALILAFIFAVFADLLRIGSRIKEIWRLAGNKMAERSVVRLKNRILELQKERDEMSAFLSSDKRVYLATLRGVLRTLVMIAMGCMILVSRAAIEAVAVGEINRLSLILHQEMKLRSPLGDAVNLYSYYLAFAFFFWAAYIAYRGMRMSSWDTEKKIITVITRFDREITSLKAKLSEREKR